MSEMLSQVELRERLRASYIDHPDNSHGQDYQNSGIRTALRIVAELAGDIDFTARCEPEGDSRSIGERNWCRVHFAPMGWRWHCDFAERPWEWRDGRDARLAAAEAASDE